VEELPTVDEIRARLAALHARITAVGGVGVTVLGVTKGHPAAVVELARAAGIDDLGENYAQELLAKAAAVSSPGVRWHHIGRLQRNKVRLLAPHVSLWQTADRGELVNEIARRAPGAAVLVQVDTTGEEGKGGCPVAAVPALVDACRTAGLDVRGLMTVGPTDPEVSPGPGFATVRGLVDRLGLEICSMGMSDDLEVAVREGSTMVRVGRGLFGPRVR
jgi:pyridoxal phosphate enzyme (YggS family)